MPVRGDQKTSVSAPFGWTTGITPVTGDANPRRRRPGDAAVVRVLHRQVVARIADQRVGEVAAAAERDSPRRCRTSASSCRRRGRMPARGPPRSARSTCRPSRERWIVSRVASGAIASELASQTPCRLSYATTGSLARVDVPGRHRGRCQPGRMPSRHVRPPSFEVAKPMLAAPPVRFRPSWKSVTVVAPTVWESGSTCVSCWLSPFECRSRWMRVLTTSQSLEPRHAHRRRRCPAPPRRRPGRRRRRTRPRSGRCPLARRCGRSHPGRRGSPRARFRGSRGRGGRRDGGQRREEHDQSPGARAPAEP